MSEFKEIELIGEFRISVQNVLLMLSWFEIIETGLPLAAMKKEPFAEATNAPLASQDRVLVKVGFFVLLASPLPH